MRKNTKADLTSILKKDLTALTVIPDNSVFYVDGGYLLRKYVWSDDDSFHMICLKYIDFIRRHYGQNAVVVFDGYDNPSSSTKRAEQKRRAAKGTAPDIMFNGDMKPTTTQMKFMSNSKNKSRLISLLRDYCKEADVITSQADGDADHMLVSQALTEGESSGRPVVVVGNDADLVAMLISDGGDNSDMYIMLETNPVNIFKVKDMQENFSHQCRELIIAMHCITGSDTTSACYNKGKPTGVAALKSLSDDEITQMGTFLTSYEDIALKKEEIEAAGEKFMMKLYNAKTASTLNRHRYVTYNKKLKSAKASSKFTLETLPPTTLIQSIPCGPAVQG